MRRSLLLTQSWLNPVFSLLRLSAILMLLVVRCSPWLLVLPLRRLRQPATLLLATLVTDRLPRAITRLVPSRVVKKLLKLTIYKVKIIVVCPP